MEFLIIAVVIISIFSSIAKQLKKSMKKETPFDPWSLGSDSSEDDYNNLEEEKEIEEDQGGLIVEGKPKTTHLERWERLQRTFSRTEKTEQDDSPPGKKEREHLEPHFFEDEKKVSLPTRDTLDFEVELKNILLTGKKLHLGIVLSEVLGSPKSLRPYGRKRA